MGGGKRKAESPLKSEPSLKIRRICSKHSDQDQVQDGPVRNSPSLPDGDQAEDSVPSSIPAPLTKANLRLLEEMTNSKGSKIAPSGYSSNTGTTKDTKSRLSTTDQGFEPKLRANGVLDAISSERNPPANRAKVQERLRQSRATASPPPSEHLRFARGIQKASNERDIEHVFSKFVMKDPLDDPALTEQEDGEQEYGANLDKQWVDFPTDQGFNNSLAAPKPDRVEGYSRTAFPPNIGELGGSATLVKNDPNFVALPHFAAEFKDFGKDMRKAGVQACYDGAAMVYGRNQALNHIGQPDPPRHAVPMSLTSDGSNWKAYLHYAHENEKTKEVQYFQCLTAKGDMTWYEDYKEGRKIVRNMQDLARENSADLRDRLQRHHELNARAPVQTADGKTSTGSASRPGSARSSGKDTDPRVPSIASSSGASGSRVGTQTPPNLKKAVPPSPLSKAVPPSPLSKAMLPSPLSKAMPPPPPSTGAGGTPRKRSEVQRPLNGPPAANARPQPSHSSGSRPATPTSSRASVASADSRRPTSDRDKSDRRSYRDRDEGVQSLQHRRSDSPDRSRAPRPQERDRDARSRDSRSDRVSSASGSSSTHVSKASSAAGPRVTGRPQGELTKRPELVEKSRMTAPTTDPAYGRRW